MIIDTHTHLTNMEPADRERQIKVARELGIGITVDMANRAEIAPRVVELADSRRDVFCGVAVHPHSVETYNPSKDLSLFRRLIQENEKVVCVGECGLDYSRGNGERAEKQRKLFRDMIRLAREVRLPLNMHTDRLSSSDLIKILKEERAFEVGGMVHNFGANLEAARSYLDMGFYISISVLVHHPMADRLRNVIKEVSIGQIVMDSDAPAAKLIRTGDSTEPYPFDMDNISELRMLRYICDKIAEVKGLDLQQVEDVTTMNSRRLFRLPLA